MTRDQKINIVLDELGHEDIIAGYPEKRIRKCLAAAFTRIERDQAAGIDSIGVLRELYGFYVSDVRYSEKGQGLPVSEALNGLHVLIEGHLDHTTKIETEGVTAWDQAAEQWEV